MRVAADTRKKVVQGLDDLDEIFMGMERFLKTFPKDDKIRKTSINLIVSTFEAVELAIGFFTSSTSKNLFSGTPLHTVMADQMQLEEHVTQSSTETRTRKICVIASSRSNVVVNN